MQIQHKQSNIHHTQIQKWTQIKRSKSKIMKSYVVVGEIWKSKKVWVLQGRTSELRYSKLTLHSMAHRRIKGSGCRIPRKLRMHARRQQHVENCMQRAH